MEHGLRRDILQHAINHSESPTKLLRGMGYMERLPIRRKLFDRESDAPPTKRMLIQNNQGEGSTSGDDQQNRRHCKRHPSRSSLTIQAGDRGGPTPSASTSHDHQLAGTTGNRRIEPKLSTTTSLPGILQPGTSGHQEIPPTPSTSATRSILQTGTNGYQHIGPTLSTTNAANTHNVVYSQGRSTAIPRQLTDDERSIERIANVYREANDFIFNGEMPEFVEVRLMDRRQHRLMTPYRLSRISDERVRLNVPSIVLRPNVVESIANGMMQYYRMRLPPRTAVMYDTTKAKVHEFCRKYRSS